MGKTSKGQSAIQGNIKGMASNILKEVIKADLSMHMAQIEAWQWFAKHLPKGELINDDLIDGMPRNMYLAVNDLTLTFHIKPETLSFLKRVVFAFKILFKLRSTLIGYPNAYVISSSSDSLAMKVNINVKRFKNGTVKASYGPVDEQTAELINNYQK